MPIRKLETEVFYHIFNRGHNKQKIFFETKDYQRFYANIERYLQTHSNIEIYAYCLLPNHFHFLLREKASSRDLDPGMATQISSFMNRLQLSYAAYFNVLYRETHKKGLKAPIFEGRFQAKQIDSDDYLEQIQVYIEHNAVKHELVDRSEDWPWTSYIPGSRSRDGVAEDFNPVFE